MNSTFSETKEINSNLNINASNTPNEFTRVEFKLLGKNILEFIYDDDFYHMKICYVTRESIRKIKKEESKKAVTDKDSENNDYHIVHIVNISKNKMYKTDPQINSKICDLLGWKYNIEELDVDCFLKDFSKHVKSSLSIALFLNLPVQEGNSCSCNQNHGGMIKVHPETPLKSFLIIELQKSSTMLYYCKESKEDIFSGKKKEECLLTKSISQTEPTIFKAMSLSMKKENLKPQKTEKENDNGKVKKKKKIEELYYEKALFLMNEGKPQEAIPLLEKCLDKGYLNEGTLINMAIAFNHTKQYHRSVKLCDEIIKIYPNYEFAYEKKADVLVILKQNKEALECYEQALNINDKNSELHIGKAKALFFLRRFEDSIKSINTAISMNPNERLHYSVKALCYIELRNFEEAVKCFNKYLDLGGDDIETLNQIAKMYHDYKDYTKAIFYYDKIISKTPDNVSTLVHKALCLGILERKEEALKICETIMSYEPNNSKALEIIHVLKNK